jgi:thymidylate kinase
MNSKIILVDGLPGTGKSSFSQEISFQLRARGREALWYYEIHKK